MGKRSNFEKITKDQYYTIDIRAVNTLLPYLKEKIKFIEPCAGSGMLIDQLGKNGHTCVYACDIDPKREDIFRKDVFEIDSFDVDFDCIITNPCWTRNILHPMIEKFLSLTDKPIWLLFDADWMHTKQSAALMEHCLSVVSIGRLIWIPDTTMSGKDNCCWYQFSREKVRTSFYGR